MWVGIGIAIIVAVVLIVGIAIIIYINREPESYISFDEYIQMNNIVLPEIEGGNNNNKPSSSSSSPMIQTNTNNNSDTAAVDFGDYDDVSVAMSTHVPPATSTYPPDPLADHDI